MPKWYEKASVQTGLVGATALIIIASVTGLYKLSQDDLEVKNNIEAAIELFITEEMEANLLSDELDLKPSLMTLDETIGTMERINEEASLISNTVNLSKIHRLVKKHGTKDTRRELKKYINENAGAHKRLSDFVTYIAENHDSVNRLDDVNYVNEIYKKYIMLLNNRNDKRNDLHSYVTNLTLKSFDL